MLYNLTLILQGIKRGWGLLSVQFALALFMYVFLFYRLRNVLGFSLFLNDSGWDADFPQRFQHGR